MTLFTEENFKKHLRERAKESWFNNHSSIDYEGYCNLPWEEEKNNVKKYANKYKVSIYNYGSLKGFTSVGRNRLIKVFFSCLISLWFLISLSPSNINDFALFIFRSFFIVTFLSLSVSLIYLIIILFSTKTTSFTLSADYSQWEINSGFFYPIDKIIEDICEWSNDIYQEKILEWKTQAERSLGISREEVTKEKQTITNAQNHLGIANLNVLPYYMSGWTLTTALSAAKERDTIKTERDRIERERNSRPNITIATYQSLVKSDSDLPKVKQNLIVSERELKKVREIITNAQNHLQVTNLTNLPEMNGQTLIQALTNVNVLTRERNTAQSNLTLAQTELTDLEVTAKNLLRAFWDKETELTTTQQETEQLVKDLKNQRDDYQLKWDASQEELTEKNVIYYSLLQEEQKKVEKLKKDKEKELAVLNFALFLAKIQNSLTKYELNQSEEAVDELIEKVILNYQQLQEQISQKELALQELKILENLTTQQSAEKAKLESEIKELKERLEQARINIKELEEKLINTSKELQSEKEKKEEELKKKQAENEDLFQKLKDKEKELAKNEAEKKENQQKTVESTATLRREKTELEKKNEDIWKNYKQKLVEQAELINVVNNLSGVISALAPKIGNLQNIVVNNSGNISAEGALFLGANFGNETDLSNIVNNYTPQNDKSLQSLVEIPSTN